MSINSLTNAAIARRTDFAPSNRAPSTLSEIATAASGMPAATPPGGAVVNNGTSSSNGINTAMNVLFGYIPKEILTLYVAVIAVIHPIPAVAGSGSTNTLTIDALSAVKVMPQDKVAFWVFLVATPLVFWVVFAAKLKGAQKPLPLAFSTWPLWEMFAATVAYVAWAFALPANPFREYGWYTPGIASVVVLVTSTILGLLAPLFQQNLASGT